MLGKIVVLPARKQHKQKLLRILILFHEKYPAAGLDALVHTIKPIHPCSRNTLHRLMKLHNIHSVRKKPYKITTNSKHNESELLVQKPPEQHSKGHTTFTIAHKLTTLRNTSRILVLTPSGIAE